MCNLSQGIRQKAYAEGYAESYAEGRFEVRLESIRALIETVGASQWAGDGSAEDKGAGSSGNLGGSGKQRLLTELQRVRTVIPDAYSRENCSEL